MLASIAATLLFAAQPAEAPDPTALPVENAPALAEEEEVCRKTVLQDPSKPGGRRTQKVCKTREEWKDYSRRRT